MAMAGARVRAGRQQPDAKEFFARVGLDGGPAAFAEESFFSAHRGSNRGKKQEEERRGAAPAIAARISPLKPKAAE